ncbi:MAG: hypothetical protein JOZ41_20395 [Chloroflexi bacterium]|nr:hypothetical protein [Chloroflexota bacterium]
MGYFASEVLCFVTDRDVLAGEDLSLDAFKRSITVIEDQDADRLRARYVSRFADTTSPYFRQFIADRGPQSDAVYYTGYLWDTLRHPEVITEGRVAAEVAHRHDLYVFWDLHNARKIFIPDYWKFPLRSILLLSGRDLLRGLRHLPEDLYIFDDAVEVSFILTHECLEDGQRYCLRAT